MRARSYPLHIAVIELGFAVFAFGCGLYNAPLWLAGLASFGLVAYWTHTRARILNRMRGPAWARGVTAALAVLIAIQTGAYWLGLGVGARFDDSAQYACDQRADVSCAAAQSRDVAG